MLAFVSHSQEDTGVYSALCLALDSAGISRWDSSTMSPTESLADQLRDAIHRCQACIFVATHRSIISRWCLAEVGAFWGAAKKIFLFLGEPDLNDSELPPQFKGGLWTSDARSLIAALLKEPDISTMPTLERPGNLFWLGHDLTRAIRLIMFEPNARDELDKNLRQAIYHFDEIGLRVPLARHILLTALKTHRSGIALSEGQRNRIATSIAKAKNEIGYAIERLQPNFIGFPNIDQLNRVDQEVQKTEFWQLLRDDGAESTSAEKASADDTN